MMNLNQIGKQRAAKRKSRKEEIIRTTSWSAGPGCHGGCGVLAHVKDGRLTKVEGDPAHPWNQGRLCARCLAMTQYVYHPERITRPMKRVGERGEGKWQEISWDEAYDLAEEKMNRIRQEFGPESMIFAHGTGRDVGAWICLLAYAYGSPNVMFALSGIACYGPRVSAVNTIQGDYCVADAAQWLPGRYENPRFRIPKCMIIWGYDIQASCPDGFFGHWIVDLMKRGTKLITIDPRLSWFASRSKHWLRLRPGTDGALAMGFLNVIIREGLYGRSFVKNWTNGPFLVRSDTGNLLRESELFPGGKSANFIGWDAKRNEPVPWDSDKVTWGGGATDVALEGRYEVTLAGGQKVPCETAWSLFCERVGEYSPENVAEITWVPKQSIIESARFYANSKPASIHWGVPIDMTPAASSTAQAIATLWCITGNLDVPGGNVISRYALDAIPYPQVGVKGVISIDPEAHQKRIGIDRYGPLEKFIQRAQPDLVLEQIFTERPYPIKGMWIQGCNIVAGLGLDPRRWVQALKKLDFVAAVDLFMNPTTQMADLVFPAATFLEKNGIRSWWVPLQSINKAISVQDCKPDVEISCELARRFDPNFRWTDINEMFDEILKPSGLKFGDLQKKGWVLPPEGHPTTPYHRFSKGLLRLDRRPGFKTPSGKIELYSSHRERWGHDPIPSHEEPPFTPIKSPELYKEYPLILSTGRRSPAYFHAEHRMIPWLRQIEPDPLVEIHPITAKSLGIGSGEWVWIENWLGRAKFKAKVTLVVPEWMVMASHGWWFPEKPAGEPVLYGVWESAINQLLPMGFQGKDGLGAPIKHLLCRVYKA